jgi:hypothetical protein
VTDLLGVDSIAAELRAAGPDELPEIRASFAVIAADPDAPDWWTGLARLAVVAIDRMPGVDPAVTLGALGPDLMAAREAALAGEGALDGSRSRARRRRRGPP